MTITYDRIRVKKFTAAGSAVAKRRGNVYSKGMKSPPNTSWQGVSGWYNKLVDNKGDYYHQHVVIPRVLKLLNLKADSSLLDLAGGQGVLERHLSPKIIYQGVDIAGSLIRAAQGRSKNSLHRFTVGDITKTLPINKKDFSHVCLILSMQNIERADLVIANAKNYLKRGGKLVIVLNHPCFRIPRQSSWIIDERNKLQSRKVNLYMTPLKIPITIHPGQPNSALTWSFHQPISYYSHILSGNSFLIEKIEEWVSDKESSGRFAKMENRGREEFPLFLTIKAVYLHN